MRKKRIYLSGNMTPDPKIYTEWTIDFQIALDHVEDYEISRSTGTIGETPRFIVRHDLARLSRCDILVVNLGVMNQFVHLTGLVVEVYEAYRMGIPVYAFTEGMRSPQADSPWISEFITKEFPNKNALLDFLMYEDNL